jgi:YidC/Oxa1 family membrane protein insertase
MQERQGRLFLALFLSLGIWMLLQYFFFPPEIKPPAKSDQELSDTVNQSESQTKKETDPQNQLPGSGGTASGQTLTGQKVPSAPAPVDPSKIKKFYINTDPYLIELSSLGGRIERFYIQNHPEPDGSELQILKDPARHTIEFNGKQYMAIEISRNAGFDFNPIFDKEQIPVSVFNNLLFSASESEEGKKIEFSAPSPNGSFVLKKIYQFFPKENYFKFDLEIINLKNEKLVFAQKKQPIYFRSFGSLGPLLRPLEELSDREKSSFFRYYRVDGSFDDFMDGVTTDGALTRFFGGSTENEERYDLKRASSEGVDFAGMGSRYFIAVLDPLDEKEAPDAVALDKKTGNETGTLFVYEDILLEPKETRRLSFAAYVGVREPDGMAFRDPDLDPRKNKKSPFYGLSEALDKSFNQGLTTPFRNGIVWILKKIHTFVVPNYGWAIIIFAVLFKAVFFPLNQKQADSMKKMQELSPQIKELNERYADDPQTKNQKIMELYRKNKVNPMGGCLPMLIQIPIFIALYTAFSDTVDLWESPFLWIQDLSEPDTIYTLTGFMGISAIHLNALPLIMVGTQVLQSRLTVVSSDPNQKMMMYMLPVVMLYFFWSMPSGVTLYWTIQNILSIAQQVLTNKFGKDAKLKRDAAGGTSSSSGSNPNSSGKNFQNSGSPAQRRSQQNRGRRKK